MAVSSPEAKGNKEKKRKKKKRVFLILFSLFFFSWFEAEACPVESSNKDHTLAIAIAAAVGGLVVVAGLIYLCRRPGRSSYEELSKA